MRASNRSNLNDTYPSTDNYLPNYRFSYCRFNWLRNWRIWNYYRDYFPIKLVKTADLAADKNYLFCVYPHGVASAASLLNFQSNATNFDELYPGIDPYLVVLNANYRVPFTKDIWLALGESETVRLPST